MASLSKRMTDSSSASSSAGAIGRGRLLSAAVAAALAFAATSLWALEGRASGRAPEVSIVASTSVVNVCDSPGARPRVRLKAEGVTPGCGARYTWKATGGRIEGNGAAEVAWDFTGTGVDFSGERTSPGDPPSKNWYEVTVTVEGGAACGVRNAVSAPTRVVVWSCPPSVETPGGRPNGANVGRLSETPRCPNVVLCCHEVGKGQLMLVSAQLVGGSPGIKASYNWTPHGGEIASGQGTSSVMVDVKKSAGGTVLTTLEVGGYGSRCSSTCTTVVPPPPPGPPPPPPPPADDCRDVYERIIYRPLPPGRRASVVRGPRRPRPKWRLVKRCPKPASIRHW